MGSIVHRSVPTNLKWSPNCSHAHALFQDRFKDVQVGSSGSVHCTSFHQTFTRLDRWTPSFSPTKVSFIWILHPLNLDLLIDFLWTAPIGFRLVTTL